MLHFKGSDFVAIDLNKFDGHSVDYSASQSIIRPVSKSVGHLVSRAISQSLSQSTC